MKRKAIQLANQTIVVSLPAKWVRQQGIKKGDEIDLEEKGNQLIVAFKIIDKKEERAEIDVSNWNDRLIRLVLSGLNKKGFDEIVVKYDKSSTAKTLEELIKNLFTGFAIVEQRINECVIKSISKDLESEFNTALRRAFLVMLGMSESCLNMIKKGKFKGLSELTSLENTNNQLTNYCERVLNKKAYDEDKKKCSLYTIIWNLEKICDEYKYICKYLSKSQNDKNIISGKVINFFEEVNYFVNSYYEIFYKFDIQKLNGLIAEKEKIEDAGKHLLATAKGKEVLVLYYLLNIVSKTVDFSASMFIVNS